MSFPNPSSTNPIHRHIRRHHHRPNPEIKPELDAILNGLAGSVILWKYPASLFLLNWVVGVNVFRPALVDNWWA